MKSIGIWGSCLARDTIDLATTYSDQLSVTAYIARQTWLSATSEPIRYPGDELTSKFQSRMVRGDFASNAIPTILNSAESSDAIVLDIIDERFNSVRLPGGKFFTYSTESQKARVVSHFSNRAMVKPGTDRHADQWYQAASQVRKALDPVIEKVFVLGGPWASMNQDGATLQRDSRFPLSRWNQINSWYLEQLDELGFKIIQLPNELAIADEGHRWGASPFHYIPEAYDFWAGKLLAEISEK